MRFSIIVPFYNEREYIQVFLEAVTSEIGPSSDCEVLLIDNGADDGSRAMAELFSGVHILDEPVRDPYLARNRGIRAARGSYVLFLDADCAPRPGWLRAIREEVARTEPDVLLGDLAFPAPTPPLLGAYRDYYNTKTGWLLQQDLRCCFYGHAGNMGVRRSVFEETGLFRGMPEVGDTAILHDLLAVRPEARIVHVPGAVVTHLEVRTFRQCLAKLRQCGEYTRDYLGTRGFRALTLPEKLQVMNQCFQERSYGFGRRVRMVWALLLGVLAFHVGRLTRPRTG